MLLQIIPFKMNFPFHLMLLSNLLLFCGRQWQKHMGAYASVIDLYAFCISLQFLYVHFCLFQWVKKPSNVELIFEVIFLGRGCSWRGVRSPNYCQLSEPEDRDHIHHLVHVTVVERTCVCPFDFQRRTPYVSVCFFTSPAHSTTPCLTAPFPPGRLPLARL